MENNTYKTDEITENFISQLLELFKCYKLVEEEAKLKPICENGISEDSESINRMFINLGTEFYNLDANEKLLAIKFTIKTHFQMTKGELLGSGKILCYQLHDISETYRSFDSNGDLMP